MRCLFPLLRLTKTIEGNRRLLNGIQVGAMLCSKRKCHTYNKTMKDSVFKNILVNIRAFFTKNLSKEINRTQVGLLDLESRIEEMEGAMKAYARNLYSYRSVLQYFHP